jgi:hypothetical protein
MKKRVTKTSESGAPLWQCDRCHEWLLREDFAQQDGRRGYVCCACHGVETDAVGSVLSLAFLTGGSPPISRDRIRRRFCAELNRVRRDRREALLDPQDTPKVEQRLFSQLKEIPPDWQPAVWQILTDPRDIRSRAALWLGFRYGALTELQRRRVAYAWAKTVSQHVELEQEADLAPVLEALDRVVETGSVTKAASQAVHTMLSKLCYSSEYTARTHQLAGMSFSAVLLPEGRDAMLGAGSWGFDALARIHDMPPVQCYLEFATLLGQSVELELDNAKSKDRLEHWTGLERL